MVMMSHEQVIYSSIAIVLRELNIQSTSLIAQEVQSLCIAQAKSSCCIAMRLQQVKITAHTARRVLRDWIKQIAFHVWRQRLLFDDFRHSREISNILNKVKLCQEYNVSMSYKYRSVQDWNTNGYHSMCIHDQSTVKSTLGSLCAFKIEAQESLLWQPTCIQVWNTVWHFKYSFCKWCLHKV